MYMHIWSPIDAVIVDTSAYHREQCDFIGIYNKILPAFFDLIDERNILLLTHPVLDGEIKKHISESEVISRLSNAKVALKKYKDVLSLIDCSVDDMVSSIDNLELNTKLIDAFELKYKKATELPYPDVEKVFEQYFSAKPPFSSSGTKKSEFPDAFILSSLKDYIYQNPSKCVLIISDDPDWEKTLSDVPRAILTKNIGDGIRTLQNCDDLTPVFNAALPDIKNKLLSLIECEAFEIMGYETIDDPEITSISVKSVSDLFIPLKITEDSVLLKTTVEFEISGSATILDEDRSIWDSEDRNYIYTAYSNVDFENAFAEEKCDILIKFDPEEHLSYVQVEDVKLNVHYNVCVDISEGTSIFTNCEEDAEADIKDALEEYYKH